MLAEPKFPTLLFRPDHGYKPYRLRCRFAMDAFPNRGQLETAKHTAAEQFIKDMEKQGWEYLDQHGIQMSGPYSESVITGVPSMREQLKAKDAVYAVAQGARLLPQKRDLVASVPPLALSERWEFELAAVFLRKTIVMEYNENDF